MAERHEINGLDWLTAETLAACQEVQRRQEEMLPLLALALEIRPEEVFYTWALRRCQQRGRLSEEAWQFFFHGLECDLWHTGDGRFLRLDCGPKGRIDTFTAWGVLQFIMTSTHPWGEYRDLKRAFAATEPPWDQYAGDLGKFGEVWDQLEGWGCLQTADAQLVDFLQRHTSIGADGLQRLAFPPGTPERLQIDCLVAHRQRLSEEGRRLLAGHRTAQVS